MAPGEGASFNVIPHPYDSKGVTNMLGLGKKKGPNRPFAHAPDCKIMKADPTTEIPWQEIETGLLVAECQCGKEYWHELPADGRVRRDPLDPSTFRHAPACDQRDVTDSAIIRATLRVQDRAGYWWVESSMCACCWQVPYYAAEAGT
jgi:hypothetical protein